MIGFLGLITSVWAEKFDHAAAVTNFVVTPLALLLGTFYSVDRLAPWFQSVAHANPVYHAIMSFRYGFIGRSEEHTSELQSLMRISYAVFCLKKKNKHTLRIKLAPTELTEEQRLTPTTTSHITQ